VWERAKAHDGYVGKKEVFQKEQKEWDKEQKRIKKEEGVKEEDGEEVEKPKKGG
jgi:hypothetical protein